MNIGHIDDINIKDETHIFCHRCGKVNFPYELIEEKDCIECGTVLHCQVKNCTGMATVWAWNNIYCIKHKEELKDSINKLIFNKVILN